MKKIVSIVIILAIVIGIGYVIYLNTGPIVHESLVVKGETLRVGNMTLRKVTEQNREHSVSLPEGGFIIHLEGYFPDPTKRIHAENNYDVKIVDSTGAVMMDYNVKFRFKKKEKKEGAQQILSDIKPGKTSKRIFTLDSNADRNITITIIRKECDTVANELYLRIRQKRS